MIFALALSALVQAAPASATQTQAPPDLTGMWINQYTPDLARALVNAGYVVAMLGYSTIYRATVGFSLWQLGMESIVLDAADPTTFRDLGELYGADAKRAYYHSTPIALRGSARRFEVLGANVARDDVAVYFQHEAIDGADPATFAIISPGGLARSGAKWFRLIDTDHGSCALPITKAEAERVLAGEDDELGGEDDDY